MIKSLFITLVVLLAAIPAFAQDSGWIGVSIADQADRGVLVRNVETNSPAEKAGLRANDIILRYNGQEVVGVQQLTRVVSETPVGRSVEVTVRRDNREQTLKVTAEKAPSGFAGLRRIQTPDFTVFRDQVARNVPHFDGLFSASTTQAAGVRVDSLTPQLREFFGVKAGAGVLVASVDANSAAAKAGLKAGDVVIAVDGKSVSSPSDFTRELRPARAASTLRIVRDKQERDLPVGN